MVPLVGDPICTFNLVLAQRVAIFETVSRCVCNAIGRAFRAGRKPQVGVGNFLETVVLLKCCIIFNVVHIFPRTFVVVSSTPLDKELQTTLLQR